MRNPASQSHFGDATLRIAILLYQNLDQLDATGPYEVLASVPDCRLWLVTRDGLPVRDMRGLVLTPSASFAELTEADVLVVPGGAGQEQLMEDEVTLAWVRQVAAGAKLVISVCTGALVVGAAGLLRGKRATTHWASHDLLPLFGAEAIRERVVVDGNLISSAGVSAGIDAALVAVTQLRGEAVTRAIQLGMEYAPQPPYPGGTPETTPPEILALVREKFTLLHQSRRETALRARARLGLE